jgi:PAS domain S-box-containing protein
MAADNTYPHRVERRAETELEHSFFREREARREVSRILESISDAFFAVDHEWRFTYVNGRAEQFWSRTRADLLGKNMWEEFPQAAGSESFAEIRRAMEEGVTTTFEAVSPDLRAWVYGSAYPSPEGVSVFLQDITDREKAEEALQESEELHRLIVEGARDYAIFTTDLQGRIESWSPGAAAIFGWTAEGAIGMPTARTFVPEDRASDEPESELATARENGVAPDVRWHLRKDGSRVFIEGVTRYVRGVRGLPHGFLKISQDVTERRAAVAALRKSERRLRSLVSNVPGAIFHCVIREGHPTMEYVSDRIEEITGYPASDFVDDRVRSYLSVVHPEDLPKNEVAVTRAIESGEPYVLEYRVLHADGGIRWVVERGSGALSPAGEPLSIDGAIFDSTERRGLAEERERLLSHEWTARAQSEERRRLSRELHDRVARDMALVHQSLELHEALRETDPERAEGKMELAKETVKRALHSTRNLSMQLRRREASRSLEPALADLLRDLAPPAVGSGLTIEGDESPVPSEVRTQLFAILREAIRNAVTHSGCEEILVGLEISGEAIVGRVEDDGQGSEEERPAGGIRSMRERAALLNGTLEVSSSPGRGTTVTVWVPLEEEA